MDAEPSLGPRPLYLYWQTLSFSRERLGLPGGDASNGDDLVNRLTSTLHQALIAAGLGLMIYAIVILPFYRLFLSPVAKFPGPKLAAVTSWYEFYFDIIQGGTYMSQVQKMHDKYGPIVRINPWELSINDADFFNSIYVAGAARRTHMFPRQRVNIGVDGSIVATETHELHRLRRRPLEPFFSRKGVSLLEPLLEEEARLLDHRFRVLRGTGSVVQLEHVYTAIAVDTINRICFEDPPVALAEADFDPTMHNLIKQSLSKVSFAAHFPWMIRLVENVPDFLMDALVPGAAGPRKIMEYLRHQIGTEIDRIRAGSESSSTLPSGAIASPKGSIVRHLLNSDLPAAEKSTGRIQGELMSLVVGGTSSTSRLLTVASYYLLSDEGMLERLREELREPMAGFPERVPTWTELERLPFLQGCIKEGLRLAPPIARRLPRRCPDEAIQYKQWSIPKDTPVGIQLPGMHHDPDVYPEPEKFKPERWLDADRRMYRNLGSYSRGARDCLGQNLSNATMSLALAVMFRPQAPRITIFETDEEDVLPRLDYIIMTPKKGHRELRVTVH